MYSFSISFFLIRGYRVDSLEKAEIIGPWDSRQIPNPPSITAMLKDAARAYPIISMDGSIYLASFQLGPYGQHWWFEVGENIPTELEQYQLINGKREAKWSLDIPIAELSRRRTFGGKTIYTT